MRKLVFAGLVLATSLMSISSATPAKAQVVDLARTLGGVFNNGTGDLGTTTQRSKNLGRGSARLFDLSSATVGVDLEAGPIWYRSRGQGLQMGAVEIAAGQTVTSPLKPFYLAGSQRTVFRALDSVTYLWTIFQTGLASGLKVEWFEIEGQIGIGLLGISAAKAEWSFDILSPRVGASVAAHIGRFRLALGVHSEYVWRLLGPGYATRGLTLAFRFDTAQPEVVPQGAPSTGLDGVSKQ
jgi:hypothetical protein